MSEPTNDPDSHGTETGAPTFVGGAFGVTGRELEDGVGGGADDPVAAFQEIEDAEDTGPDIVAAADVPEHLQDDVSEARTGPSDVEGTSSEPSPGERNEPV